MNSLVICLNQETSPFLFTKSFALNIGTTTTCYRLSLSGKLQPWLRKTHVLGKLTQQRHINRSIAWTIAKSAEFNKMV